MGRPAAPPQPEFHVAAVRLAGLPGGRVRWECGVRSHCGFDPFVTCTREDRRGTQRAARGPLVGSAPEARPSALEASVRTELRRENRQGRGTSFPHSIRAMLLLHLSDIHFCAPACNSPRTDPERSYRTRLLQDARTQLHELGELDAILITGDIAFKGDAQEYSAALQWIDELATACGSTLRRVFVVPGNHDVDRNTCKQRSVRNAHQAILNAEGGRRERSLREHWQDPEAARTLLQPLSAYNEFAARFDCQIYPPERMYWTEDLDLGDGVTLRLNGLTSTLTSGAGASSGTDDTRDSLYLSPLQTVLDPEDDVVNLVLSHHPPEWFLDHDAVDEAICARAQIQCFGHKHRQRISRDLGYIRFSAGAVNPARHEVGWEPGYNIIDVQITGAGEQREIVINAHLRTWQANPEMFRPKLDRDRDPVFRQRIAFPASLQRRPAPARPAGPQPDASESRSATEERLVPQAPERHLILRFWDLTSSNRRALAEKLGLLEPDENRLPEPERYRRALMRAGERGLLKRVREEIERMENL